jgi:hypothetical protein
MSTHSDFTGTWRADLAASRLRGPTPSEITAEVIYADPELRVIMTIRTPNAADSQIAFDVCAIGGPRRNTVLGAEWVSSSRWVGTELLIESEVSHAGRQMHFCDYWSISNDGRRLTMEHREDDLHGQITVFDRIDGE